MVQAQSPSGVLLQPWWREEHFPGLWEAEKLIFQRTNEIRRQHGLPPLTFDPTLRVAARQHSAEMLELGYFSHVSPRSQWAWPPIRAYLAGNWEAVVGENIAQGESSRSLTPQELCQKLMAGWLESPTHRQNIFSAEYTRLGVGVVGRKGKYYATQLFALNHYQFHRVTLQEVKENYYRLTCDFTTTAKQIDVWINGEYSRSYTPRAEGQVHYQQDFREETGQYKIQLAADTLVSYTISLDTDVPLSQAMEEEQNSKRIIMQTIHLQGVTVTSYLLRGKGRVLADVKVVRVALDGTMLESVNIGPERELAFEVRLPKNSGRHKVGLYPQHGPKYTILNLFFVDTDRPLRRAFIPRFQ